MPRRKRGTTPVPPERSLITIPQPEIVEPDIPKQFSIVPLGKKQALKDMPDAPHPYYIASKEGLLLHKRMRIGRAIIPTESGPPNLGETTGGSFWYGAPQIPKEICSQIVDFFRGVYTGIKAEAEVFLLLHKTEDIWKIWIPSQKVTGVSVDSRYEPLHNAEFGIPADYLRVGSVHSHCMMGAFHSGTDVGDAEIFEGLHITIGKVMDETPEFDTMIMVNKLKFTYKHDLVGDWTDLSIPAEESWYDWVGLPQDKDIKGIELFEKYPKPTPVYQYTGTGYRSSPNDWGHYRGPSEDKGYGYGNYNLWDDWRGSSDDDLDEYFFKRYGIGAPKSLLPENPRNEEPKSDDIRTYDGFVSDYASKDFKEFVDGMPNKVLDKLLDESLLLDREWEDLEDSNAPLIDLRVLFMQKMARIASVLDDLGMEATYSIRPAKITKPKEN